MERWRSTPEDKLDGGVSAINIGGILQRLAGSDSNLKALQVAVTGSQTTSKTTLLMLLTGQCAFLTKEQTGTRVRTRVAVQYQPDQTQNALIKMTYTEGNIEVVPVPPNEFLSKHTAAFEDAEFDPVGLCDVTILVNQPSAGLCVIDHAGFVPAEPGATHTTTQAETTINELFMHSPTPRGLLVHCHPLKEVLNPGSGFHTRLNLERVPGENMILALTRADEMAISTIAPALRLSGIFQPSADGFFEVSALEILQWLVATISEHQKDKNQGRYFPANMQVFFIATGRLPSESLKGLSPQAALHKLKTSANETLALFKSIFDAVQEWQNENVRIRSMTADELRDFDAIVGVEALQRVILKKQMESFVATAKNLGPLTRSRIDLAQQQLAAARMALTRSPDPVKRICDTIEGIVRNFHDISEAQPYDGERLKSGPGFPPASVSSKGFFASTFDKLKKRTDFGFSAADEDKILRLLRNFREFPATEDCNGTNPREFVEKSLAKLLGDYNTRYHEASGMLRRSKILLAVLLQLIELKPPSSDELMKLKRSLSSTATVDTADSLAHHISSVFSHVFGSDGSETGGAFFAAQRASLAIYLQSSCIIQAMRGDPQVDFLFSSSSPQSEEYDHRVDEKLNQHSWFHKPHLAAALFHPEELRTESGRSEHSTNHLSLLDLLDKYKSGLGMSLGGTDQPLTEGDSASGAAASQAVFADVEEPSIGSDLEKAVVAMFFDGPMRAMLVRLDEHTQALRTTLSSSITSIFASAPIFLHQNKNFVREYSGCRSQNPFVRMIHQGAPGAPGAGSTLAHNLPAILRDAITTGLGASVSPALGALASTLAGDVVAKLTAALQPQASSGGSLKLENWAIPIHLISQVDTAEPEVRAELVAMLLRLNESPDVLLPNVDSAAHNPVEEHSIEYVFKRHISSGIFSFMMGTLMVVNSSAYDWRHAGMREDHKIELLERFASVLLGYNYPFTAAERPVSQRNLDPNLLIPWLSFHLEHLRSKTETVALTEFEANSMPTSPLFQLAAAYAIHAPDPKWLEFSSSLRALHGHWLRGQVAFMNRSLIEILALGRYDLGLQKARLQNSVDEKEAKVRWLTELAEQLRAYGNYVEQNAQRLEPAFVDPAAYTPLRTRPSWNVPDKRSLMPSGASDHVQMADRLKKLLGFSTSTDNGGSKQTQPAQQNGSTSNGVVKSKQNEPVQSGSAITNGVQSKNNESASESGKAKGKEPQLE